MDELCGVQTHDYLKQAFLIESGAALRYLYFAKIAIFEGFPDIAQLFRDLAECIISNAHGNLDLLKRVGDPTTDLPIGMTDCNLLAALAAEQRDFSENYPHFASIAHEEGFPDIASWFETLMKHKNVHITKLEAALQTLNATAPVSP